MESKRDGLEKRPKDELIDSESPVGKTHSNSKDAVRKYSKCPICDSNLHFTYHTDFNLNTTQETVKCPECVIRIRRVLHRLQ